MQYSCWFRAGPWAGRSVDIEADSEDEAARKMLEDKPETPSVVGEFTHIQVAWTDERFRCATFEIREGDLVIPPIRF